MCVRRCETQCSALRPGTHVPPASGAVCLKGPNLPGRTEISTVGYGEGNGNPFQDSCLGWGENVPRTEEPDRLQSTGLQRMDDRSRLGSGYRFNLGAASEFSKSSSISF